MERLWEIDFLRGIAIVMMVIFHTFWDLNYFGFIHVSLYTGLFGLFQLATATLFLVLVGAMLAMNSEKHGKKFPIAFAERGVRLFLVALFISAATLALFPENFIYFGIIHLIAVSTLLSIPFARNRLASLVAAVLVISIPIMFNLKQVGVNSLVWLGLAQPKPTFDFFPVLPWFGAVLLGIFLWHLLYKNGKIIFKIKKPEGWAADLLQALGRNSLAIYLGHQPIIFGLIFLASTAFK